MKAFHASYHFWLDRQIGFHHRVWVLLRNTQKQKGFASYKLYTKNSPFGSWVGCSHLSVIRTLVAIRTSLLVILNAKFICEIEVSEEVVISLPPFAQSRISTAAPMDSSQSNSLLVLWGGTKKIHFDSLEMLTAKIFGKLIVNKNDFAIEHLR